jgi:hypothetical protein
MHEEKKSLSVDLFLSERKLIKNPTTNASSYGKRHKKERKEKKAFLYAINASLLIYSSF